MAFDREAVATVRLFITTVSDLNAFPNSQHVQSSWHPPGKPSEVDGLQTLLTKVDDPVLPGRKQTAHSPPFLLGSPESAQGHILSIANVFI